MLYKHPKERPWRENKDKIADKNSSLDVHNDFQNQVMGGHHRRIETWNLC